MEYLKDSIAPEFVKYFYDDLKFAVLDLEEYKRIFTDEQLQIDLLNDTAPSFFNRLHRLYWISFIMNVGRYLDNADFKGQTNVSFGTLVVKASGLPFEGSIKSISGELQGLGDSFKKVRHKLIAHADLNTLTNKEGYHFNVETAKVEAIYVLIEKALNLYFDHFDGLTRSWQKLPLPKGALSLLAKLRCAREG